MDFWRQKRRAASVGRFVWKNDRRSGRLPVIMAKDSVTKFAHRPPMITILSDHASQDRGAETMGDDAIATQADKDQLNLETRLASTFDILRHKNTRCPLAVAVYGDWGTGKTSAMRWLETRLKEWNQLDAPKRQGHPRAYPVWFDPWRYHSKEEVWRGIIAEVILALFRVGNLNQENVLPRMVQAVKKFGGFLGRSFIHAVANMEFEAGGKGKVSGVAEGEVKFSAKGEMFRDIWEEYDKATHPHKAHLNQFEDTLRTWVTDFLGPQAPSDKKARGITREPARLVLFIDDLDRCLPEVTLEVIEALKLYLNIDHLVFVVGLDETVVRSVVAEHYKKAGVDTAKAARYLDKVFQVDLRIPPSEAQMPDYMRTQIDALNKTTGSYWHDIMERSGHRETLENVLIALARNNPREVKRLLNSALLRGRAASLDDRLSDTNNPADPTAERFAQGVQVFLLHRILADRLLQSDDLLTYSHHQQWFVTASQLLRKAFKACGRDWTEFQKMIPELKGISVTDAVSKVDAKLGLRPKPQPSDDGSSECAALYEHLTTNPPKAHPDLWTSELLLRLLLVPFSQAVAAHFPPLRIEDVGTAPLVLNFTHLPDFLRECIALAANVAVTDVKPEQIAQITEINLSHTPMTEAELRFLAPAQSLELLDLTDCISLRSTHGLPFLPVLKRLGLRGCTSLEDGAALKGLSGLRQLETLLLNGCTRLRNTQGLPALPMLTTLSLQNCTSLTGEEALKGLVGLNRLEVLDLDGCTGLYTTQSMPHLPALVELDLQSCTGLESEGALSGLRELDRLEILYLNNCTGLRSTNVLPLLPALKKLYMQHCTGLEGIGALQGLAGLAWADLIDLTGCTNLGQQSLSQLRYQLPSSCRIIGPDGKDVIWE